MSRGLVFSCPTRLINWSWLTLIYEPVCYLGHLLGEGEEDLPKTRVKCVGAYALSLQQF